nr:hypothetical protein [Tanacetum cinerariifolium]
MVNTRTDADLSVAVQNALQALLPQIRVEIHEEFHTSSGLVVTGTTVIITTVMGQTGEVVVITIEATTTTLATTS